MVAAVDDLNSVTLVDCDVTGNHGGTYSKTDTANNVHNVMLYITNTSSIAKLSGVELTPAGGTYLRVSGNTSERGWGTAGANGGTCEFDLSGQTVAGDILVDGISELAMTIADSSSYTGAVNTDGTAAAALTVTLDSSSTWTLTGDCYVTEFDGDMANVLTNGHTLYVNGSAMEWSATEPAHTP